MTTARDEGGGAGGPCGAGPGDHAFDVTADLAPRTLVEASAGTGKTYALCGLATHLIGTGAATVDQLLVVTFTNLATDDLGDRIRDRLASVRAGLADGAPRSEDVVVAALAASPDLDAVRRRVDDALVDLAELSVATIHGFAQRALVDFGPLVGLDPNLQIVVDDRAILADAVADELAVQALACPANPVDDEDLVWVPPQRRVLEAARLLDSVPDLEIRPPQILQLSFADLVAQQQTEYLAEKELVDQALAAATTKAAERAAREPLDARFDGQEVVRSAWVAAQAVRRARDRRRAAGVRSSRDLLTDLRDALRNDDTGRLAAAVRRRYRVALIDEFQDTDRVQWDIFDACFGRDEGSRLVVVGDPKQAIYRFRGADVYTYARVADLPGVVRRSLDTNQRSDGALLGAVETLFDGVTFGPSAPFVDVHQSPRRPWSGIRWRDGFDAAAPLPPFRLGLCAPGADEKLPQGALAAQARVDVDVIDWIRRLRAGAEIVDEDSESGWRRVGFDDIAILIDTNQRAIELHRMLLGHDVPAAVHSDDDVRSDTARAAWDAGGSGWLHPPSEAAWHWQLLVTALARPSDPALVRAAATTVFGPPLESDATLASEENEAAIAHFQERLATWAKVLSSQGPGSLLASLRADSSWVARTVNRPDGGRFATDLSHIGELLVTLAGGGPVSADELLSVLAPGGEDATEATAQFLNRRLAAEAPSVTIMTTHKAKGLEFPIVGCLGLHQSPQPQQESKGKRRGARFHDVAADAEVLDVARAGSSLAAEAEEAAADDLRKLYVALTRAAHHVFTYWLPPRKTAGPLTRVLFDRDEHGAIDPEAFVLRTGAADVSTSRDDEPGRPDARHLLDLIAERSRRAAPDGAAAEPTFAWDELAPTDGSVLDDDHGVGDLEEHVATGAGDLRCAELSRPLDRRARRWSFTAVGNAMESRPHDDDAPTAGGTDEVTSEPPGAAATPAPPGNGSGPLQPLRSGADFGVLVHEVLEQIDFAAGRDDIHRAVQHALAAHPVPLVPRGRREDLGDGVEALVDGLGTALTAPLGKAAGAGSALRLADIARGDRLSECRFDLRLDTVVGPDPVGARIAASLLDDTFGLAADDPYRPWAEELAGGRFDLDLAGFLTGSIDLVYRVRDARGNERFHVADYKTNKLDAYDPASLVRAMAEGDYPLQALLYSVGLHRYLRWRLADYDAAVHLGAVTYLFVRGMTGADVPVGVDPPGVARWAIPVTVIERLDALFAGREVARR